jgi:hypothetical protein
MTTPSETAAIRQAMRSALPDDPVQKTPIEPRFLYVPRSHLRALSPGAPLVLGMRGAGKSLWWHALQDDALQPLIPAEGTGGGIRRRSGVQRSVKAGFGENQSRDYPDKDELRQLMATHDPRDIWRSVVLRHAVPAEAGLPKDWDSLIVWIRENPSPVKAMILDADDRLVANRGELLIVFDALDRAADNWDSLWRLLRGLLQSLLEFQSLRAIRVKAFLRSDMVQDPQVYNFPDGSKLTNGAVHLDWPRQELYALLWQYLGNANPGGEDFRALTTTITGQDWPRRKGPGGIYDVPGVLRNDEDTQRTLFHRLTGPFMGTHQTRGTPYAWLPNHLGDTHQKASPRTFLRALRVAADSAGDGQTTAINYHGINQGVLQASEGRVAELAEDYPWIRDVTLPLRGIIVPCDFTEIEARWDSAGVAVRLQDTSQNAAVRLPPQSFQRDGYSGLRRDLEEMGIFDRSRDGRVNLPDVYRLGFKAGRRGGIKPLK